MGRPGSALGLGQEMVSGLGFPFYNLYRLALLSRGDSLVDMVSGEPSWLIRTGFHVFDRLCHLNLDRWGWQTVCVARWPGTASARTTAREELSCPV